jgi:hypothetical protein
VRDFTSTAQDYFDVVGKNERDMMANTKNYTTRLRLNKEVNFTEDFRKRFLTKDYGNYEKYDKNSVVQETERGENDRGFDRFFKNESEMTLRSNTIEGEEAREKQASALEGILQEDSYADQTIMDRLEGVKFQMNHPDEVQRRENDIMHAKGLDQ